MPASDLIVSGQAAVFTIAVVPPPGHRQVPGLRLRLRTPSGQVRGVESGQIRYGAGEAKAEVVLREVGHWEYQWQDADRVYEHGRLFVRKTGFAP